MMIAFITIKSSLVPLIESLCAQIYFRFEISVVCSHLLFFTECDKRNAESTLNLIERSSGFSTPAIQVAINTGRCHPQRKPRCRVARPKDFRSQATVLEKSAVMPTLASKRGMRANTARHVLECADVKTNAKLGKCVRRG